MLSDWSHALGIVEEISKALQSFSMGSIFLLQSFSTGAILLMEGRLSEAQCITKTAKSGVNCTDRSLDEEMAF
jgi:hypothetical protein